jgi:hypothetical protein
MDELDALIEYDDTVMVSVDIYPHHQMLISTERRK